MIRRATEDDIADLVWTARDMVEESPAWEAFDPEVMRKTLEGIIKRSGAAFVASFPGRDRLAGAAVAFLTQRPFSGELFVADLAVYVAPEHRGSGLAKRLIGVLESWAREEGAVEVQLGISSRISVPRTAALYRSLGYSETAVVMGKRLE